MIVILCEKLTRSLAGVLVVMLASLIISVEGIVSHDHRRVAHYQRCVSQPGAAWCCLVLTALDKAVEHLYRQHTRLLGKETWTIQYSALDFKYFC